MAGELLHTRIPWLCDTMDNQTAAALEYESNNLFIFNQQGIEEFAGTITDTAAFQKAVIRFAGPVDNPTPIESIPRPEIPPLNMPQARVTERVEVDPQREAYFPLQITPIDSGKPFYIKMRIEANKELLETGNGRLILGFHIDPIYKVEWNNLGETIRYTMKVPRGSAISPSISSAEKVTVQATDTDPREFMLEARKWDISRPVPITVDYSVHSPASKRNFNLSQQYIIYLDRDLFGGAVFGRQDTDRAKPTERPKPKASPYAGMLRKFDIDRDGKLTFDEAPVRMQQRWDDADANADGNVDEQEFLRYRDSLRP
jgi:hypothetical protein